ncbi:MAG TPA: sugar ABC transporter ATP-binding protein [Ktedonobacteraceae bacterium]|nr:sugar ABC transporter ATP-binding protein [Ktedonobacteraceae bacterium]
MTEPSEPIVELAGITKQFGTVQVLRGVDLSLYPGEVHALVGENGAGKSTLVKLLAGIHRPGAGVIKIGGKEVELHNPIQARHLGIAVIHQEPTLFPDLNVAENVYMGRHPRDRFGRVDWKRMYREVEQLLASLGVHLNVYAPVQGLSVADQQLVEIAKALSLDSRVLIMDEPTAALSAHEVHELFAIVRQLRERGVAILFVSHRLEEIFELAQRVTVLRDGVRVATAPISELTTEEIIRQMVGRALETLYPKSAVEPGEVILDVRHLTRTGTFEDVSFQVRRGEILGFAGLVGAGRTEVARVVFGIDRADAGEIRIGGKLVQMHSPKTAMNYGIAYVPEDRHQHGLVMDFSIARNMTLPILRQTSLLGLVNQRREREIAKDYSAQLQVRSSGIDQLVKALSGGNQQKVVLAKWLITNPSVLILDEPTRGIDVGSKAEVHRIVSELASKGLAIMLISSDLPEVLAMADRVLVMHEGRIAAEFTHADVDQEKVMFAATGQVTNGYSQ